MLEAEELPSSLKEQLIQPQAVTVNAKKLTKAKLLLRWPMLILICLLMVGNFYIYDNPAALITPLWELFSAQGMSHEDFQLQYSFFYSAYAIPNMALPFFGGVIVDKLGVRSTLLGFLIVITLAQCLFAFGASIGSMTVMIAARVLYGLGGESSTVAQNVILAQWYRGRELTFSFGITLSFCRGGSVLNNALSPWLADRFGLNFSLWFGAILCAVCVAATVILIPVDLRAEAIIKEHNDKLEEDQKKENALEDIAGDKDAGDAADEADAKCCGPKAIAEIKETACACRHFNALYWLMILSTLAGYGVVQVFNNTAQDFLLERDYFVEPDSLSDCCCWAAPNVTHHRGDSPNGTHIDVVENCYNTWVKDNKNYYPSHEELVQCRAGCDFSAIDAFAVRSSAPPLNLTDDQKDAIICLNNGAVGGPPYYGLSPNSSLNKPPFAIAPNAPYLKAYCDRNSEAITTASFIMSIPYYINIMSSPFLGFLIDFVGKSGLLLAVTPMLFLVAHLLLAMVTTASAIVPLILQGVAYAFYAAALWAPIAYIVEEKYQGMAYGLMTALLNTGTAVFPIITAYIYGNSGNHYMPNVEYFFVGLSAFALLIGVVINIVDAVYAKKDNPKAGCMDGELNRRHWNDLNDPSADKEAERRRSRSSSR